MKDNKNHFGDLNAEKVLKQTLEQRPKLLIEKVEKIKKRIYDARDEGKTSTIILVNIGTIGYIGTILINDLRASGFLIEEHYDQYNLTTAITIDWSGLEAQK